MDPLFGMIFYFSIAITISFICSVLEATLLSTPTSFIQSKIDSGSKAAIKFMKLKNERVDDAISAILTLNTAAHAVGTSLASIEAVEIFGMKNFAIISGIMTLLILVLSELIPKSIGAHYWKRMTSITANILTWMIYITYPIVWMSRYIMAIFSPKTEEATISREEISSMATIGEREKIFTGRESKIIKNLLALDKLTVGNIMTPRTVVKSFDANTFLKDFPDEFEFSRIPIWEDTEDNIVGIAYKSDIYQDYDVYQPGLTIKHTDYDSDIIFIPDSSSVNVLFEKFLKTKQHLAIVVDKYGTFVGVASFEDVIENLLGIEIVDETDTVEDLQKLAKEKWEERKRSMNG